MTDSYHGWHPDVLTVLNHSFFFLQVFQGFRSIAASLKSFQDISVQLLKVIRRLPGFCFLIYKLCSSASCQQVKRGSLPEQRNPAAAVASSGRRSSDQTSNQLVSLASDLWGAALSGHGALTAWPLGLSFQVKRPVLEERAHTIGHTGRNSPASPASMTYPPQRSQQQVSRYRLWWGAWSRCSVWAYDEVLNTHRCMWLPDL